MQSGGSSRAEPPWLAGVLIAATIGPALEPDCTASEFSGSATGTPTPSWIQASREAAVDQVAGVLSSSNAPESGRTVAILQCTTTAVSGLDLQPNVPFILPASWHSTVDGLMP